MRWLSEMAVLSFVGVVSVFVALVLLAPLKLLLELARRRLGRGSRGRR